MNSETWLSDCRILSSRQGADNRVMPQDVWLMKYFDLRVEQGSFVWEQNLEPNVLGHDAIIGSLP